MVLNSQVQIPLELQVQHALAVCAVYRTPLFSSGCPHCQTTLSRSSTTVLLRRVMEEWGLVDDRELQNWKGGVVCMTCQHFAYGVDQPCHTMVGCNLRQKQLQQGEHLKKRCKLWAPTWQKEMVWALEAG